LTIACLPIASANANAQKFPDLDKSPMDVASYPTDYKNADKLASDLKAPKGRLELAPAGKVWRTGANEAVEITL
jgi:hypothetical protein